MSSKRPSRKNRPPNATERKRRELQGYLDKLRRVPNKSQRDLELQAELQEALSGMKRR